MTRYCCAVPPAVITPIRRCGGMCRFPLPWAWAAASLTHDPLFVCVAKGQHDHPTFSLMIISPVVSLLVKLLHAENPGCILAVRLFLHTVNSHQNINQILIERSLVSSLVGILESVALR